MEYFIKRFLQFVFAWGLSPIYFTIMIILYTLNWINGDDVEDLNGSLKKWINCASIGVFFNE